jgi:Uma2 family endonuclease
MASHPLPWASAEEYLRYEEGSEQRHEYLDGVIYAMAGGSPNHSFLMAALVAAFHGVLKGTGCKVAVADLRVKVDRGSLYAYPDLAIICEMPVYDGENLTNPTVIVEVLSQTTRTYDRGLKFARYRTLPSLMEYVLVSQWGPRIEVFRRPAANNPDAEWDVEVLQGMDAVCRLEHPQCSIALADVYDGITFEERVDA